MAQVEIRIPLGIEDIIPDPIVKADWPDNFPLPPRGTQIIGMGATCNGLLNPTLAQTPDNRTGYLLDYNERLRKMKWRQI